MTITSKDIFNQRFTVVRKGYSAGEVDQCLERIASEVDKINSVMAEKNTELTAKDEAVEQKDAEIERLNEVIGNLNTKIRQYEDELHNIRLQQQAEEALAAENEKDALIAELQRALAEKEDSEKIIADTLIEAKRSAKDILTAAENEAYKITHNANAEYQKIMASYKETCKNSSDTLRWLVKEINEKIDFIENEITQAEEDQE